jgi:hypothetical protein
VRTHNLYVDDEGDTHWRDIEVQWVEERYASKLSVRLPANGIIFCENLPPIPPDLELESLSQTIGSDHFVEEMVVRFTHTIDMDWLRYWAESRVYCRHCRRL